MSFSLNVATVEPSLYATAAGAGAEATRRQALRGVKRDRFEAEVELNAETEALSLGHIVGISHARFGLSAGADFRVLGLEPMRKKRRLRLTLWK